MPTATKSGPPPSRASHKPSRKVLALAGAVLLLVVLAVTAVVAYNFGKPDDSVRVARSGTGTIAMLNESRTAGCITSGATRLCSELAVTGRLVPQVGLKVGYAREWVDFPGGSEDLLLIYSLDINH